MEEKKTPTSKPSWASPGGTAAPSAKPAPAAKPTPAAAPAAPAAAASGNQFTQWHEVVSGDTLWKIAKKFYGDGSLYMEIFKANQDVLKDPDKIQVGQKLRIP
jgi:5'-nucleotidase